MNRNQERENLDFNGRRGHARQQAFQPQHDPNSAYRQDGPYEPDRLVWQPFLPPDEEPIRERDTPGKRAGRRLPGLVALFFLIVAAFIALRFWDVIGAFFTSIADIGAPNRTMEQRTLGLATFGVIGVLIVAIVRILKNRES